MSKSEKRISFTLEKPDKARLPQEIRDANLNRQAGAMHDKRGDQGPQESEWDEDRPVLTEKEKRDIFERVLKEFNDWSGGDNHYTKTAPPSERLNEKILRLKAAIIEEWLDKENEVSKSVLDDWRKELEF